MIKFSNNEWAQKCFERAVEKTSLEEVMQAFVNYVCDEDAREFIGYYCDDKNCFPEDEDE